MAARIRSLRTLTAPGHAPTSALASALAALAVLAGVRDELRAGTRVSVLPLDREEDAVSASNSESEDAVSVTATVLRVEAGRSQATIAVDPSDGSAPSESAVMSVSRLRPLVGGSALHSAMIGDASLMDTVVEFLSHALSANVSPSTSSDHWLLEQELELYALRFLSSLLTDSRHASALLQRTDLLSLLIACAKRCPAASSGLHASASHLAQLERQSSRLRLRWLDLRQPPRWPRNRREDEAAQEKERKQAAASAASSDHGLAAALPHQPCARAAKSSLPTTVSFAVPAPSKYLLLESSKAGAPPVVHFTRDVQVHIPADFMASLGQQRSSGSMRRLEEQLRIEAQGMGVSGDADWCILADAPIDLTITQYYFEVTLLSSHPVAVGLTPKPPASSAAGPSAAEQEAAEVAAHGGRGDRRQDAGALLQAKLQQVLRARMQPWAVQSVRLQSKDGRVVRKLVESAGLVAGRDEVKPFTEPFGAEGDVIGVHWSLIDGAVTFTKNGKSLGVAFNIGAGSSSGNSSSGPASSPSSGSSRSSGALHKLYPAVSCTVPGTKVSFNFGDRPFVYSLPAESSAVESESARADRLRRAEEAERAALQREEQERTRREVERVSLEVSRNEMAQSIQDLGGLPSRRHALMALSMHRWDAGQVANWLLESGDSAIGEINRRIREEDAQKAQEAADKAKAAAAAKQAAAPATPRSTAAVPATPTAASTSMPTMYDHQHSSNLAHTPAYARPLVSLATEEEDPLMTDWLQQMEAVLIGARLERPELVQQLMRQLRAGGEDRANALLSLPANVHIPPVPKPKEPKHEVPVAPVQRAVALAELKLGMRVQLQADALVKAAAERAAANAAAAASGVIAAAAASDAASASASSCWLPTMSHLNGRIVTVCDVDREHVEVSELVRARVDTSKRQSERVATSRIHPHCGCAVCVAVAARCAFV